MIDDIVTRLRGKEHGDNDLRCKSCDSFCCHCELCDCCLEILEVCLEAADEIERLRAGFQLMAKAYTRDLGMDRHGWDADKMCEEFLKKAVRDE